MPEDLRSIWSTLSPRERDARVAEALGYQLARWPDGRQAIYGPSLHVPPCLPVIPWLDWAPARSLSAPKPYSTSWEHAGPLLDRLHADGWGLDLCYKCDGYPPEISLFHPTRDERGNEREPLTVEAETWESAISLAFVLSREQSQGGGA